MKLTIVETRRYICRKMGSGSWHVYDRVAMKNRGCYKKLPSYIN